MSYVFEIFVFTRSMSVPMGHPVQKLGKDRTVRRDDQYLPRTSQYVTDLIGDNALRAVCILR